LIDLQNETMHEAGGLAEDFPSQASGMLDAVRRLVAWAREGGLPVIWVRLAFRPGAFDAVWNSMSRDRGTFVDGEWGAEILDELDVMADDAVITKRRPSAFFDTDLDIVLRGLGVTTLYVGGASTHWAVESTVRDGHSRDYRMVVIRQCVASPMPEFHEPSLRVMASVFADVVDLDEVIG
jgi:nicotinamidase-related amidase